MRKSPDPRCKTRLLEGVSMCKCSLHLLMCTILIYENIDFLCYIYKLFSKNFLPDFY